MIPLYIAFDMSYSFAVAHHVCLPMVISVPLTALYLCLLKSSKFLTDIASLPLPKSCVLFFLKDRSLLNCLFSAVNSVISRMFFNINKSQSFTPGFICVLHTFGRDLKWNPHIHCLLSEGGAGSSIPWRNISHFNYRFLRDSFQTALLNELLSRLGDSFKKVKSSIWITSFTNLMISMMTILAKKVFISFRPQPSF